MMKKMSFSSFAFAISILSVSGNAFAADEPIRVTIDSLSNVSGNGALEACGTAVHKDKIKPLLVTLKHDESYYTTLTAPNDKWCIVYKRWTYNGKADVSATTLSEPGNLKFMTVEFPAR